MEQARQAPVEDSSTWGDSVEAMVLVVSSTLARRISLGLKQVESNPWHELSEELPDRHDHHRQGAEPDRVRRIRRSGRGHRRPHPHFGHVVEQAAEAPLRVLKKGDEGQGDGSQHRRREPASLAGAGSSSQTDVWDEFFTQHQMGDVVEGKVVRVTNFGAFVELVEGIEGLIHILQF